MKWQQALKDYQSYLRIERGLSENSISNYALDINKLITWLDESTILKVNQKHMNPSHMSL